MSKHPNQYAGLSKEDRKRHFSHELGGGKGDCLFRGRLGAEESAKKLDNYRDGYDKIDWSK